MARKKATKAKTATTTKAAAKKPKARVVSRTFTELGNVIESSREIAERLFADLTDGKMSASGRSLADETPSVNSVFGAPIANLVKKSGTDPVDLLVTTLTQRIASHDFAKAARVFSACLRNPDFPASLRQSVIPLMNANTKAISRKKEHDAEQSDYTKNRLDRAVEELTEALATFNMKIMQTDEAHRLSKGYTINAQFPPTVSEPVVMRGIPIVVLTEKAVDDPALFRLSTCLYLIEQANVIGVPMTDLDLGDADSVHEVYTVALNYAMKTLGATPMPNLLVRVESDAAWFALLPTSTHVPVRDVQFADDFHRSRTGAVLDPALRALRTQRIRARRLEFEAEHFDLIHDIRVAESRLSGLKDKRKEASDAFSAFVGCLPSVREATLRAHIEKRVNFDLIGVLGLADRLAIRNRWDEDVLKPALIMRAEYGELRATIKACKTDLDSKLAQLDSAKLAARSPLRAQTVRDNHAATLPTAKESSIRVPLEIVEDKPRKKGRRRNKVHPLFLKMQKAAHAAV